MRAIVGIEGDDIFCYGKHGGCLWNSGDCKTDADCSKYTTASTKYSDQGPEACPIHDANDQHRR